MAIEHVVVMKEKEPLSAAQEKEVFAQFLHMVENLPGVESGSMGRNTRANNFSDHTHAVVLRFADRASLDIFYPHAEHKVLGKLFAATFKDFIVVDYETARA